MQEIPNQKIKSNVGIYKKRLICIMKNNEVCLTMSSTSEMTSVKMSASHCLKNINIVRSFHFTSKVWIPCLD